MNFENEREGSHERFTVEQVHEQGISVFNEDVLFVQDNECGVIDGAGSLNKWNDPESGKTGGYLASHIVQKVVESSPDLSPREQLFKANRQLVQEMHSRDINMRDRSSLWSATAALVRIHEDQFSWAQVGDSRIVVIMRDGTFKTLGSDLDFDKETLVLWKQLAAEDGIPDIRHDKRMEDQITKVRGRANIDYGLLNGDEEIEQFLRSGSGEESLKNISAILLFTDGLTIPKEDPRAEDDIAGLVRLYLEGGISHVKEHIRSLEREDPECRRFPRGKRHDDIAALAISFA
ncbi:MAG: protein phosphatase 2C domain-containing protein [bacterium]|nr:protein phosphatase 2C domain-containing protein [bacterium]